MSNFLEIEGEAVPTPSLFEWALQDISSSDAGRTQDGKMHKDRTVQVRTLKLTWNNPTPSVVSKILKIVNKKVYMNVTYQDAMENKKLTKKFYVGDRTAPMKIWTVGNKRYEQLTFEFIERG